MTSKLARSMTAFLVSTETVIRSPEKIFGTDSSPNMSWMSRLCKNFKETFCQARIVNLEKFNETLLEMQLVSFGSRGQVLIVR